MSAAYASEFGFVIGIIIMQTMSIYENYLIHETFLKDSINDWKMKNTITLKSIALYIELEALCGQTSLFMQISILMQIPNCNIVRKSNIEQWKRKT